MVGFTYLQLLRFYKKLLRLRSHGINKLDDNFVYKNSAYEKGIKNLWYYEMQELGYHYRITDFTVSFAKLLIAAGYTVIEVIDAGYSLSSLKGLTLKLKFTCSTDVILS